MKDSRPLQHLVPAVTVANEEVSKVPERLVPAEVAELRDAFVRRMRWYQATYGKKSIEVTIAKAFIGDLDVLSAKWSSSATGGNDEVERQSPRPGQSPKEVA